MPPVYKPGDEARIRFRVTNSQGEGVQAALGLQVVDEAVFALAEKQPGFAKVFFYLEQEVHEAALRDPLDRHAGYRGAGGSGEGRAARPRGARAVRGHGDGERQQVRDRVRPHRSADEVLAEYRGALPGALRGAGAAAGGRADARLPAEAQGRSCRRSLPRPAMRDAWDTGLRVERVPWDCQQRYYVVRSAGPDKRFDTGDDLAAYLEVRTRKVAGPPTSTRSASMSRSSTIAVRSTGGRRSTGSVMDQAGAAVAGATVTVREMATGATRTATTNAAGQFTLAGLAPGEYEVQVAVAGLPRRVADGDAQGARPRGALGDVERRRSDANGGGEPRSALTVAACGGVAGRRAGRCGRRRARRRHRRRSPALPRRRCRRRRRWPMARDGWMLKDARAINTATARQEGEGPVGAAAPRVRSYFPEALYINPEIITDRDGRASIVDSDGRLHHHLAHGDDGLHHARRAGQRHVEPQGLSGFLRRSRPAGHAHAGRPRLDSGGRLQLLGRARRRQPATAGRTTGSRWWRTSPTRTSRWNPAASAARSSRSRRSASENSS